MHTSRIHVRRVAIVVVVVDEDMEGTNCALHAVMWRGVGGMAWDDGMTRLAVVYLAHTSVRWGVDVLRAFCGIVFVIVYCVNSP